MGAWRWSSEASRFASSHHLTARESCEPIQRRRPFGTPRRSGFDITTSPRDGAPGGIRFSGCQDGEVLGCTANCNIAYSIFFILEL